MSTRIVNQCQLPNAPYYVLCKDRFMSGWGKAEGMDNVCIFPCESEEEAEIVEQNAFNHDSMESIEIHEGKPLLSEDIYYSLLGKEDSSRWYKKDGF